MSGLTATYISATSFSVATDLTGDFAVGVRVRADCGVDGEKYGTVGTVSYSSPNTTVGVTLDSGSLTSNLITVWHGNDVPNSLCNHASLHMIDGRDEITPADIGAMPADRQINTIAPLYGGGNLWSNLDLGVDVADTDGTGVVELATASEALAGTDATRAMTPATTRAVVETIPRENLIIDGNFDHWFEGTSQTSSGYGSDTMWYNSNVGSTKTHSRQAFALGDTDTWDAPASYFSRTIVSSVAGASNGVYKAQKVEDVKKLAGRKVTLSFRAKADAAKNIAVEAYQDFGTGGSPSSAVSGIGSQLVALTTAWQDFEITIDMPSILGKTLGSNNNNYTAVNFWFDAGSSFGTRAASLGQQSGTFDIAQVKLEIGDYGTPFVAPDPTNGAAQCARHFQQFSRTGGASVALNPLGIGHVTAGPNSLYFVPLQPMRTAPSVSFSAPATFVAAITGALFNPLTAVSATTIDACGVYVEGTISSSYTAYYPLALCPNTSSTAKIICDARL